MLDTLETDKINIYILETLNLIAQITAGVSAIVALLVALRALQISKDAQRNTIRERVFEWQFEAIRDIFLGMNVFLECYSNYEIDKKIGNDFNEVKRLYEVEKLSDQFDTTVEKYEFILPIDIYTPIAKLSSACNQEVTNLYTHKPVKGHMALFKTSTVISTKVNEMFGVEELSHENKKLIESYAKKAKE